jgi:ParB family transcriptional regulator, chromosome partitioning protein
MVKPKGLGRGLDALLAGDVAEAASQDALMMLNVAQMQPGKYQPRSYMDNVALQTLADSIKAQGIMQPILVRALASGRYEIIAGERRWRASQLAGLSEVPVLVREIADESALAMALIENIQRENLNPLEEAFGIKRLIDEFSMTHEKAAQAVGRSRVAVSNLLRLLSLSEPVQDLLMHNKIDMGHARALIGLNGAQQIMLAEQAIQNNLSVREVEALVKKIDGSGVPATQKQHHKIDVNHDVLRLQNALSDKLGATVSIQQGVKGSGTLKINYANLDQLDEIVSKISR